MTTNNLFEARAQDRVLPRQGGIQIAHRPRTKVAVTTFMLGLVTLAPGLAVAQEPTTPPAAVLPAATSPVPAAPAPNANPPPPPSGVFQPAHAHPGLWGDERYRSPGLSVALSLQPLPIDFGNLYADNIGWGVAYTAVEVALLAPMMWLTGTHMNHGYNTNRGWSSREEGAMIGLVSGYVAVKLVAGLHAGYAAQRFNRGFEPRAMAFVAPTAGGAVLAWARTF